MIDTNFRYITKRAIDNNDPIYPDASPQAREFFGGPAKYKGPFAVTVFDDTHVDVSSGILQMGSGDLEIEAASEFECDVSQDGTLYIYHLCYSKMTAGSEVVTSILKSSFTRPTREYKNFDGGERWVFPIICAEVEVDDNILGEPVQINYGYPAAAGVLS